MLAQSVGERVALERGDHAGDGIIKRGFAVEVRLPEAGEKYEVVVPPALIKTFADGVWCVSFPGRRLSAVGVWTDNVLWFLVLRFLARRHQ